jgi:hypothetical protein
MVMVMVMVILQVYGYGYGYIAGLLVSGGPLVMVKGILTDSQTH